MAVQNWRSPENPKCVSPWKEEEAQGVRGSKDHQGATFERQENQKMSGPLGRWSFRERET